MIDYPHPSLSDGTILLRPWTEQDLPAVERASNDPYIVATTSVPFPYAHAAGREWLERQWQRQYEAEEKGLPFCIADSQTDEALGFIGLWLRNLSLGRVHFGYWVVPQARGRRVASSALRLLSGWTLKNLDVVRLELVVELWNVASQRVAERAGFMREGVLHSYVEIDEIYRDVFMYARVADSERGT